YASEECWVVNGLLRSDHRSSLESRQQCDRCPVCKAPLSTQPAVVGTDRLLGVPGRFSVRRCASCGLGVTQPRLGPGDPFEQLYNGPYGTHIDGSTYLPRTLTSVYRRLRRPQQLTAFTLARPANRRPGWVLDVGCGKGDP